MKIATKILSILCLLAVLACATLPCFKLTGDYQTVVTMLDSISMAIPEESMPLIEELLATQGITVDIKGTLNSFANLLEPIKDGEITIMDFVTVSTTCTEVANQLSGLPMEGLAIEEGNPMAEMLSGINSMITSLAQMGAVLPIVSYILLIPVVLFGLLAFFVVLRIILRILGRKGLGVGITILALLNAGFMIGLPMLIAEFATAELPFGLEATNVPYIMVGCCIANCIIWLIGRNAKSKKVKEEAVVETPVAAAPVAPVVEEPVVEEAPVEVAEEVVEDEVVVDTELVEEVVEETV